MAINQGDDLGTVTGTTALDTPGAPGAPGPDVRFLSGGGEMGERIREFDWSATPIGPIAGWPQSLRTSVSICLHSRFPIILWWGEDLTVIYNDAYIPIFAGKHPEALGRPGLSRYAWGDLEVRSVIEPMLRSVLERGEATWSEDEQLIVERRGFLEEAYFTWSCSPIQDESGKVGGVFTAVTETTDKVIGRRRLGILRDLAGTALEATTTDGAYRNAAAILAQHPLDLPFFLLYALDERGECARLTGRSGWSDSTAWPETIALSHSDAADSPLASVAATGQAQLVTDPTERFGIPPGDSWPKPPRTALVLPLIRPGRRVPYGVFVVGISPHQPLDDDYTSFLRLIADQIATAISNVLTYEQERRRLHELFMHAPAIVAVLRGPEHVFELVNPPAMTLIGGERDVVGRSVADALPDFAARGFTKLLDTVYHSGEPFVGEEMSTQVVRAEDGAREKRFFNSIYLPYRGDDGAVQGILIHAVDVSDQVRARQRVEEQNRALEMITRGAPLAETLESLVRSIEKQSPTGVRGSILLLDRDGKHLRHGAAPSLPSAFNEAIDGVEIGPRAGSCGTAAYTRAPVIVSDIATDPRWRDYQELAAEHGLSACWSTPIFSPSGDVLGTFAMYYGEPREPSDDDRQLIEFATQTTALLIQRQRAEDVLAESERRFREMIDALPAAIYTTDAEGRLTHFNPAAVAFSGRVPELGTDRWCVSWKLYYPDGTPMPKEQCPMAVALREGRVIQGAEAVAERPDGTRVWFNPYPTPLRDAEGRIVGGINMLIDITERKRAEETRARLAAIVESSDDAIVSKDLNGIIMTWNAGAERLFGYTAEEAVGQSITILIPPDRLDEEPEILRRIRRGEPITHFETVRRRKDGTLLDISLSVSPVIDGQGRIVGASKIARDITERRALERQKDAFIAIAAHELRTPLTGIKGYSQLLTRRLRRGGDTASAESLAKLDAQVDRLIGLIDELLDVTRLESDKLLLQYAPFELDALINDVTSDVQWMSERHRIERRLEAPVTLVGDRDRIGQVLTNLLTNAIKYSPEADQIVVRSARDGDNVVISVQDFGIGIPKEKLPHVFERFYRVDGDSRASIAGLGLGLYLAAEFVDRHGGAIWIESEAGQGTTVSFSLPLAGKPSSPLPA